jgi:hypothetical protein
MALDRWMVNPSYNDLVTDYGPEFGKPKFYKVVVNQQGFPLENPSQPPHPHGGRLAAIPAGPDGKRLGYVGCRTHL